MSTITLEEHFVTESFLRATGAHDRETPPQLAELQSKLLDIGAGRIADMDKSGIDLQVLSLAAMGFDALDADTASSLARDINNELAAAVRFLPVFEAAAHLGVPIYLHPAPPPQSVRDAYYSGLPSELGFLLSIAGWGWHAETGLHTLRLIVSGLFDRLPALQLIIGHVGEGLPYALARSSGILSHAAPHLRQPVANYFQSNIHLTTSGYFTLPPLRCALEVVGIDRLLFSVDYPYSPNSRGRALLDSLPEILGEEDLAKLTHRNAEHLLGLRPAV